MSPSAAAVVEARGLGKQYRIGVAREDLTLAELALRRLRSPRRGRARNEETIWALRDVSFDVRAGEVVGFIGRNGAGKSTLLKLLSRITRPTEGTARIRGRVGSLLEVGTGFHPELSGRENVYLNGSILGMAKREIDAHFDEIVDFAGVEQFIETPVKRYSSGMYVRLAFSVAAHLLPEILIIDEVLSVGDAAFVRKCLGRIGEVAESGRTVLFVSHNAATVQRLCDRVLLLERGGVVVDGPADEVLRTYTAGLGTDELRWTRTTAARSHVRLDEVYVAGDDGGALHVVGTDTRLRIAVEFTLEQATAGVHMGINLLDANGDVVVAAGPHDAGVDVPQAAGSYRAVVEFPDDLLLGRTYGVRVSLYTSTEGLDSIDALRFTVEEVASRGTAALAGRPGDVFVPTRWRMGTVER